MGKGARKRREQDTVARFGVTDGSRSSCAWRVWVSGDEVYAAPRKMGGEIKWSFHSDGYWQHGMTKDVRRAVRPNDRARLDGGGGEDEPDTRVPEVGPGWRLALVIVFPDSELCPDAVLRTDERALDPAGVGKAVVVSVLIGDAGVTPLVVVGGSVFCELQRSGGGVVWLTRDVIDFPAQHIEHAQAWMATNASWHLPRELAEQPFGWGMSALPDGQRVTVEMWMEHWEMPDVLPDLSPFEGEVLPWSERPRDVPDDDWSCAWLVCNTGGNARLYLDPRSRCNFESLGVDAGKLHRQYRSGRLDDAWRKIGRGRTMTRIATSDHAAEVGPDVITKPPPY